MSKLRILSITIMFALLVSLAACSAKKAETVQKADNLPDVIANQDSSIKLSRLNEKVWVHTTYSQKYNAASNGLLILTGQGLVLVDTAWSNEQTKELLELAKNNFHQAVVRAILTHSHVDRAGGIAALQENGIEADSIGLTSQDIVKQGFKGPEPKLDSNPDITVGDVRIETYYPGEGHAHDNITVWLPEEKILFGGCLIKAEDASDLGSIADANVEQWPVSVTKVLKKYPDAKIVVPGHGQWGGMELINHTLELLKKG